MNDEWCYAIICRVFGHRHTQRSPIVMPGYFWCDRCQRWIFDCIIHDEEKISGLDWKANHRSRGEV